MNAQERDAAVLAVLMSEEKPIGPTDIARRIRQPWCCFDVRSPYATAQSASIMPCLKRIGAVKVGRGLYEKPAAHKEPVPA